MHKEIGIFAAHYLPHMGGVENYTYHLSQHLIKHGYRVTVITSNTDNLSEQECVDNVNILRIPSYNCIHGRYPIMKINQAGKAVRKKVKQLKFDFVIVNSRFYIHSLYGTAIAKRMQSPCIVIEHGTSHLTVHNAILDTLGGIYEHVLTLLIKRNCREYYAVSSTAAQWLSHFHIQAKGILHNAIEMNDIDHYNAKPVCNYRDKYKIKDSAIIITFTGRLVQEKGISALVEAFKMLLKKYGSIYLMIAGDGELQEELSKQANDHIILLGRLSFAEVISLLKTSNIFCLPSDSEGFSTSILEAGACSNYIVATNTGGIHEILLDEDYGVILKSNGVSDIYEGLNRVLKNPKHISRGS